MADRTQAVVVLGHGRTRDGERVISNRCLRLVAAAERVVDRSDAGVVLFSGWSAGGSRSEAEQMRDAWRGAHVELVLEPTARSTAENASRSLPLLVERGVRSVLVVCTALHALRSRLLFGRLYAAHGIVVHVVPVGVDTTPRALAWELAALPLLPVQLHTARGELRRRAS